MESHCRATGGNICTTLGFGISLWQSLPRNVRKVAKCLISFDLNHSVPSGDTDLTERLRYDLLYLERWSLLYDVEIILRTAGRVIVGK